VVELDLSSLTREVGLVGILGEQRFESWDADKQQAAKAECLRFFEDQRSLVLWSKAYGSGKSYAAAALMHEWIRRDLHRKDEDTGISLYNHDGGRVIPNGPAWRVAGKFVKMTDWLGALKSMIDGEGRRIADEIMVLQTTPLLVMDDLCRDQPSPFENGVIYRIVDYRTTMGLPFVCTTNMPPASVPEWLWGATASRLQMARFIHFDEIDYRRQRG